MFLSIFTGIGVFKFFFVRLFYVFLSDLMFDGNSLGVLGCFEVYFLG